MDSNVEEITWDPIVVSDPNRKIDYVVKGWNRTTDKITDFSTSGQKFSTSSWDDGGYWICVQAITPGAESSCSTYWGYTIDRKAVADRAEASKKIARQIEELEAKEEAEAKAAAELKAKQKAEAKAAALRKTTITCIKGKLVKKITAVKPLCPAGYKKK